MTQDQDDQARGSGYVVRGDVVSEEENQEHGTEQSRPMTAFKKVASALRGDRAADRDETGADEAAEQASADHASMGRDAADRAAADHAAVDQATADRVATDRAAAGRPGLAPDAQATDPGSPPVAGSGPPWVTRQDEAAMADSPISRETEPKRDYWDEPGAGAEGQDEPVAVTRPDVPGSGTGTGTSAVDHAVTEPDMFGTTGRAGDETAPMPEVSPDPAGAATIADVPAADASAAGAAGAAGAATGRHAASPADGELRPGEAAGALGDFSDLTYGNLIPDAATYTDQWQQIQYKFVDDPHASVTEAADIVAQVTAKLEAAIQERQRAIEERQRAITEQQRSLRGRWGEGTNADTETLRATLRMYKTFLDQLIGPRAG
jgi:hypothetical protein